MRIPHFTFVLLFVIIFLSLIVFAQRPSPRPIEPGGNPTTTGLQGLAHTPTAEDEGEVKFRSETIMVQVPAVVTDKSGHHLHNLKKEDFKIFENGKEQKVATTEEVNATHASVVRSTKPGVFTNALPDRDKPRLLTVIALDLVNTPFLDQSYARRELIKFLANSIDKDQPLALALITSKGLKVVHGLTSTPVALLEQLKKVSSETPEMQDVPPGIEAAAFAGNAGNIFFPVSGVQTFAYLNSFITQGDISFAQFKQEAAVETTMQAFLGIAWSLAGVPGRKTLIWATGGFPFYMDSPSSLPGGRLSLLYERTMAALNDAQVSVYPVDVRGLVSYSAPGSANPFRAGAAAVLPTTSNRAWLNNARQDVLKEFAEMTGGNAFYNTNDLAGAFQRASDDGASYYLISYYLDTKSTKAGWRQIKVKLKDKDLQVRARRGFFVTNATMNPEVTRVNDMNFAIASPFEATGIPFEMQWGTVKELAGTPKRQVPFSLHIFGPDITFEGANNAIDLAVVAVATKPEGKQGGSEATIAGNVSQNIKGNLTPEKQAIVRGHGVAFANAIALEPGQYAVRFVVRDNLSGRMGSVSTPLTVN